MDPDQRRHAAEAVQRGIDVILKTQIIVDGRRTDYSWLGPYAADLLAYAYPSWQQRWAPAHNVLDR